MDWSDERYVRVYTRDTATWKRLKWQGQTVLLHLMRKVDRAGVLEIRGEADAQAAIEAVTDLPTDVVEPGLKRLLEHEVVSVRGNKLLFPNFIEAQEATQSDAHRMREYRARRRDRAKLGLGPDVTERNAHETPRNARKGDKPKGAKAPTVTGRNDGDYIPNDPATGRSGSVTPSLAEPSLAVPDRSLDRRSKTATSSQAEASLARVREAPAPAAAPAALAPETKLPAPPVRKTALLGQTVEATSYQPLPEHETYAVALGLTPTEYRAALGDMVRKFQTRGFASPERWDARLTAFVESAATNKRSRGAPRATAPVVAANGKKPWDARQREFFGDPDEDDDEEVKEA